jgi:hypothetical protein
LSCFEKKKKKKKMEGKHNPGAQSTFAYLQAPRYVRVLSSLEVFEKRRDNRRERGSKHNGSQATFAYLQAPRCVCVLRLQVFAEGEKDRGKDGRGSKHEPEPKSTFAYLQLFRECSFKSRLFMFKRAPRKDDWDWGRLN